MIVASRLGKFWETLKTRVKLIHNIPRTHAITYTNKDAYAHVSRLLSRITPHATQVAAQLCLNWKNQRAGIRQPRTHALMVYRCLKNARLAEKKVWDQFDL